MNEGKLYWNIDKLKPWDKNPRDITKEDLERLKGQIVEVGKINNGDAQIKPLLIEEDGTILGGNMRYQAFKELGIDKLWVNIVYPKTEADRIKIALIDNDRAGYYVEKSLFDLLTEYGLGIDMNQYKVDLGKSISLADVLSMNADTTEDEAPEVSQEPAVSKLGEIYQLGKHRLMCGDATKADDVALLMGGGKADMVFTDPPYGIDYVGGPHQEFNRPRDGHTIQNDQMSDEDFSAFLKLAFANMAVAIKLGGVYYLCHSEQRSHIFRNAMLGADFLIKQCIIWNKNSMVMARQDYQWKHEPILYGWRDGGSHLFYGDRTQTTVWDINRPQVSIEHPTMKPIALVAKAINNSSKQDDIVLDLFGGSGSTLIACEQLNRSCNMMEIDPRYVDVIRKRYWQFINDNKEEGWENATKAVS